MGDFRYNWWKDSYLPNRVNQLLGAWGNTEVYTMAATVYFPQRTRVVAPLHFNNFFEKTNRFEYLSTREHTFLPADFVMCRGQCPRKEWDIECPGFTGGVRTQDCGREFIDDHSLVSRIFEAGTETVLSTTIAG